MAKILISVVMSLIVVSSGFNFRFAKIIEIAGLTEKFSIDEEVTEDIVESNEELQPEKVEENQIQNTEIKKAEIEQPKENTTVKQENNVTTSNIENKTKTESQPVTPKKQETKVENKTTNTAKANTQNNNTNNQVNTNTQQNTQSVNTQIQVPKQEQQVQQTLQVTQQPQVKQEEQKPVQEVVPAQPTREVKRNDEMIQKIKTYISTHETERMKKYGYSFVVDPSVVKITNPFTYSEFNMEACLNRIGEYRIYAQDYYVNGQYLETQCFVY